MNIRSIATTAALSIVLIFFYQNCSPSFKTLQQESKNLADSFQAERRALLGSTSNALPNASTEQIIAGLEIFSENELNSSSDENTKTLFMNEAGQVLVVWKANPQFKKCLLFGQAVEPNGGPRAFKVSAQSRYQFECSGDSQASSVNIEVREFSPRRTPQINSSKVHVFIIAGQSNAFGQDVESQSIRKPVTENWRYFNNELQELNDLGAWNDFALAYSAKNNVHVLLVATAKGGSSAHPKADIGSGNWSDGALLQNSIQQTKNALQKVAALGYQTELKGVLWVQGESDALGINSNKITKSDYIAATVNIIKRYRSELGNKLAFFIYQTGYAIGADSFGFAEVQKAQTEIAATLENIDIPYSEAKSFINKNWMWDEFHYLPVAYRHMGSVSADAVTSWLIKNRCGLGQNCEPQLIDSKCGTSHGLLLLEKPTSNLCAVGTASGVSESSAVYIWQCSGLASATRADCSASKKVLPAPAPAPPAVQSKPCSAEIVGQHKEFYAASDNIDIKLLSSSTSAEIGRSLKIFANGTLIKDDTTILYVGKSGTVLTYKGAIDIKPYIESLLIQYKKISIAYDYKIKINNEWKSCGSILTVTWKN